MLENDNISVLVGLMVLALVAGGLWNGSKTLAHVPLNDRTDYDLAISHWNTKSAARFVSQTGQKYFWRMRTCHLAVVWLVVPYMLYIVARRIWA